MDYTIAVGIQHKTALGGLEEGLDDLEDKVNKLLDEGYEPVGGITIHEITIKGYVMIEFIQAMIKR